MKLESSWTRIMSWRLNVGFNASHRNTHEIRVLARPFNVWYVKTYGEKNGMDKKLPHIWRHFYHYHFHVHCKGWSISPWDLLMLTRPNRPHCRHTGGKKKTNLKKKKKKVQKKANYQANINKRSPNMCCKWSSLKN